MRTKIIATIFIVFLATPAAIFAGAVGTATAHAAAKTPFYYGVWLPFWKSQDGAANIAVNLDTLHEVSPFSYELNSSGALIDDLHIGNGSWDAWFGAVRDAGANEYLGGS